MTKLQWYMVAGSVVLLIGATALQMMAPEPIDWTLSFETDDTRPYGSQVPYEVMQALFPEQEVRTLRRSPYPLLRDGTPDQTTVAILAENYAPGRAETEALLDYVEGGATVFIGATEFGRHLRESFGITLVGPAQIDSLSLVNPSLRMSSPYALGDAWSSYFAAVDTAHTTILGTGTGGQDSFFSSNSASSQNEQATFIRWQHGDGEVLLHSAPVAFTNFVSLKDANFAYLSGAFSYLPERPVVWVEYYAPTRAAAETPFRYLIMNPSLRTALYLLVGLVLLILLDGLRRRQRMVPVIEPPKNTTKEFVETVGRFYQRHGTHKALARDMKTHFASTVHRNYGMASNLNTDGFVEQLARRAGVSEDIVRAVAIALRRVEDDVSWSSRDLVTLRTHLDTFYRTAEGGQKEAEKRDA